MWLMLEKVLQVRLIKAANFNYILLIFAYFRKGELKDHMTVSILIYNLNSFLGGR